jgi:hypothetical protein
VLESKGTSSSTRIFLSSLNNLISKTTFSKHAHKSTETFFALSVEKKKQTWEMTRLRQNYDTNNGKGTQDKLLKLGLRTHTEIEKICFRMAF